MKKAFCLLLAACMVLSLCACSGGNDAGGGQQAEKEIIVFADASLADTLTQLGDKYMADSSDIKLVFNFALSDTLKTRIEAGAECDLFISASSAQMDELDVTELEGNDEENAEGSGENGETVEEPVTVIQFIYPETRLDLLENKVVLVVPEGNPAGLKSFDDLGDRLRDSVTTMAMGDCDVSVGQYTLEILTGYGLDEGSLAAMGLITYGSDVNEVMSFVKEGVVDCGVVYATDAAAAGMTVIDRANEEMCSQVLYPATIVKSGRYPLEAMAFLRWLYSEPSARAFIDAGFDVIPTPEAE